MRHLEAADEAFVAPVLMLTVFVMLCAMVALAYVAFATERREVTIIRRLQRGA